MHWSRPRHSVTGAPPWQNAAARKLLRVSATAQRAGLSATGARSDPAIAAGFRSAPPGGNGPGADMRGGTTFGGKSTQEDKFKNRAADPSSFGLWRCVNPVVASLPPPNRAKEKSGKKYTPQYPLTLPKPLDPLNPIPHYLNGLYMNP